MGLASHIIFHRQISQNNNPNHPQTKQPAPSTTSFWREEYIITSNAGHQQEIKKMIELSIAVTILDFNISTICFDFMRAKVRIIMKEMQTFQQHSLPFSNLL